MSQVTEKLDRDPKWDALFDAQHQLFIAAKHALQAMTLQGQEVSTGPHERLALEALTEAAKALGYNLVKTPVPARAYSVGSIRMASEIKIGDTIAGQFEVADISHGPLDRQIRFRNADETATLFFREDEMLVIEGRS